MSTIQRPSSGQDKRAPSAAGRRLGETKAEAKKKDAATAAATSTAKKESTASTASTPATPGATPAKTGDTLDRGPKRTATGTMQISTLETNASLKPAREKAVDGSGNLRRNPDPATSTTSLPTTTGTASKTTASAPATQTSTAAPRAPLPSVTTPSSAQPSSSTASSSNMSSTSATAPTAKPSSATSTSTPSASSTVPPTAQKSSASAEKPSSPTTKLETPASPTATKASVDSTKPVAKPSAPTDTPRGGAEKPVVADAKTSTTATAQQTSQAQTAAVPSSQVRPQNQEPTPKATTTTTVPASMSSASTSTTAGTGPGAPTNRNGPVVGGRKNEAVENVRLAAAGDATQKGGGQGSPSSSPQKAVATTDGTTRPSSGVSSTTPVATSPGATTPVATSPRATSPVATTPGAAARGSVPPGVSSTPAVRTASTTTMPALQQGFVGRATTTTGGVAPGATVTSAGANTTTTAVSTKGKTSAVGVVKAPSGRQLQIESKKAVETVKTRTVVERTVQTQRQENVVAVQQTATVAKTVTETVHKAAVQTAVRVAETHVATQVVTTTVQHQQNRAGSQKVELKADVASSDMAATQQASVVQAERLSTNVAGVATPFKGDGTLARSSAPDIHLDPASEKELEALSQGLSRIDVVEAARAFAESEHGFDLGPVSRAQRESDIQDAFFRETQASTVSLGSHAAPPFSNVSVALDRKLELTLELSREERAQMKAQGAPYASADDGVIGLSLGGAKAIEEMSAVLSLDLGLEVSELGDTMRTLMDSDGGGDDGGDGGGGDEGGGGDGGGSGGE